MISKSLKQLRHAKGYTQKYVAGYLGISQSAYARIEKGESQSWSAYIEKLSELYEVLPEVFFEFVSGRE